MSTPESLQARFYSKGRCFGCGPANEKGLRIESFPQASEPDAEVTATWRAEPHHQAFPGVINGGVVSTLLDCHSNWTAAHHLMRRDGLDRPPATVTAELHVRLLRPTPADRPLEISARAVASEGRKVTVEATVSADGEVTATCTGLFSAVKPGHPAYHNWDVGEEEAG